MNIKYSISPEYGFLKDFILNMRRNFDGPAQVLCRGRNVVKLFSVAKKEYVVKSFKKPGPPTSYIYSYLRKSKARRSFENSNVLLAKNINTPTPVAYIEFYSRSLLRESFYISKYYGFDFDLRAFFGKSLLYPNTEKWPKIQNKNESIKQFVKFAFEAHNKGINHMDYTCGNVLIKKRTLKSYEFSLVDVNRVKFGALGAKERVRSLSRVTDNQEELDLIAKYYGHFSGVDERVCKKLLDKAVAKHKKYIARKMCLKKFGAVGVVV